ncbi:MAG: hypothetical protein JKY02_11085 [Flavobacteriaceae bacterium]|nr:hypothetical protein [Flavobacteriaceae bacterium]
MKENKNIDRLFQEKMKGLEVTPGTHVWAAIEGKLKKKKRKVSPFWWFSGGIAALFVLGLFLFPLLNDHSKFQQKEQLIITASPEEKSPIKKDSIIQFSEPIQKDKIVLATKKILKSPSKEGEKTRVLLEKISNYLQKII